MVTKLSGKFVRAVIFIDDPGATGERLAFALELYVAQPVLLAGVVVEPESAAFDVGNIGQDVFAGNFDLSVLQILWMSKKVVIDYSHLFEQGGTNKAVEIGTRDKSHIFLRWLVLRNEL